MSTRGSGIRVAMGLLLLASVLGSFVNFVGHSEGPLVPRPEALLQGLILLQEQVGKQRRPLSWVINDQGVIQEKPRTVQREFRHDERIAATELRSPDRV